MLLIPYEGKKEQVKRQRPKYKSQYVHCCFCRSLSQFCPVAVSFLPGNVQSIVKCKEGISTFFSWIKPALILCNFLFFIFLFFTSRRFYDFYILIFFAIFRSFINSFVFLQGFCYSVRRILRLDYRFASKIPQNEGLNYSGRRIGYIYKGS